MGLIPHPPLYLSEIRPLDLWLLLFVGAAWEGLCRTALLLMKRKPPAMKQKEAQLQGLQHEVAHKRKLGPSAFVETSKLERQVLAIEKQLADTRLERKTRVEKVEKILLRHGNMMIAFLIFILYYGVPVVSLDYVEDDGIGVDVPSAPPLKSVLFPIGSVGLGVRIASFGLPDATTSVGALMVMWSSQVFCSNLMDAADAYFLS